MSEKETVDQETAELQNPENWDYDSAELHPRSKKRRTVVSVAFPNEDLQVVNSPSESVPKSKVSCDRFGSVLSKARSVSIVYDGPRRSSSIAEGTRPGSPAAASASMASRWTPAVGRCFL